MAKRPRVPAEVRERAVRLVYEPETEHKSQWAAITAIASKRGFVDLAFVIDVFSRRIVGGRASTSMRSDLAWDALEQALCDRDTDQPLVHHSDHGVTVPVHSVHGAISGSRNRAFGG